MDQRSSPSNIPARRPVDVEETVCPRCGESQQLAKVKGCIKCLQCGFKFDCNGW
jgi:ribosomal protein S27AE